VLGFKALLTLRKLRTHLLVLPFGGNKPPLRLRSRRERHSPLLTLSSEPLDSRLIRIIVRIRVLGPLQPPNNVQLLVRELDLLLKRLVLDRSPRSRVLDVGEELVELVALCRAEELSPVDVVPDVREIIVPLHRDVSDGVGVLRK
jgi:hypothetical protein